MAFEAECSVPLASIARISNRAQSDQRPLTRVIWVRALPVRVEMWDAIYGILAGAVKKIETS